MEHAHLGARPAPAPRSDRAREPRPQDHEPFLGAALPSSARGGRRGGRRRGAAAPETSLGPRSSTGPGRALRNPLTSALGTRSWQEAFPMTELRLRAESLEWREIEDEVVAIDIRDLDVPERQRQRPGHLARACRGDDARAPGRAARRDLRDRDGPVRLPTSTISSPISGHAACSKAEMSRRIDIPTLRAALWTQRALLQARYRLRRRGVEHVSVSPPPTPPGLGRPRGRCAPPAAVATPASSGCSCSSAGRPRRAGPGRS